MPRASHSPLHTATAEDTIPADITSALALDSQSRLVDVDTDAVVCPHCLEDQDSEFCRCWTPSYIEFTWRGREVA